MGNSLWTGWFISTILIFMPLNNDSNIIHQCYLCSLNLFKQSKERFPPILCETKARKSSLMKSIIKWRWSKNFVLWFFGWNTKLLPAEAVEVKNQRIDFVLKDFIAQWATVHMNEVGGRSSSEHHSPSLPHSLLKKSRLPTIPPPRGNTVPHPSHIQDGYTNWHLNPATHSLGQTSFSL